MLECWIISSHEVGGRNVNSFYTLRLCVFAGDILTALHQRSFNFSSALSSQTPHSLRRS